MKKQNTVFGSLLIAILLFSLTSFQNVTKPHLIVGNWQILEKQKYVFTHSDSSLFLDRIYFSSDEFSAGFSLIDKNGDEKELDLAYKIYEADEEFKTPMIVFKNTCDKSFLLVFSIENLSKAFLEIKFQKKYSAEGINVENGILKFERTAGPPENMD